MKVALTGSHGTGKTTLLKRLGELLAERGEAVAVCREVPRVIIDEVGDETFFRRGSNSPLRQLLVFFHQVVEEGLRDREASLVLADRTVVDHLAYSVELFPEIEGSAEGRALLAAVKVWVSQYDLIVKLPIEFPVVDDGVREGEAAFQVSIDQTIDRLYAWAEVTPKVVRGGVNDRARAVVALIDAMRGARDA